jgi:hypothetical protein
MKSSKYDIGDRVWFWNKGGIKSAPLTAIKSMDKKPTEYWSNETNLTSVVLFPTKDIAIKCINEVKQDFDENNPDDSFFGVKV